ncbi:MAG: ATPase, T2SS/T4P/T4SS family [Faecousia sp.]
MMCAWKQLLSVLPPRMRPEVDRLGKNSLQELRLRLGAPPELVFGGESRWLGGSVSREDIGYCVNAASRYSPWSAATAAQGYVTAPGGHRIGLCGEVVCRDGIVTGIREVSSLCIRIARDFPGIGKRAAEYPGSILILGAPGWGKTTLLRDLIRQIGERECVSVVDERGELFPEGLERGRRTDVLTGCPKSPGIDMVLKTMGPSCVAVDEITAEADARALLRAANCGVRLLATAHGTSSADFRKRLVYRPLAEHGVFQTLLILHPDKSYRAERVAL